MFIVPYSLPPLDRSPVNGFRLAKYSDKERVAELSAPIAVFRRDVRAAKRQPVRGQALAPGRRSEQQHLVRTS